MALDLNDPKCIDYSSKIPLFPFDAYGDFEFALVSYIESGEAGSEKNKGEKEFDLATVRVVNSTAEGIKEGDLYGFFFQTGGNGMSVKSRPYRAAELRNFHKAVLKVDPTDRTFDGNAARKTLLVSELDGTDNVRLKTQKGSEIEGKPGTFYRNDTWTAA